MTGSNRASRWFSAASFAVLSVLLGIAPAQARIVKLQITRMESPTFEGISFGKTGRYEKMVGRALGKWIQTIRATQ